MIGIHTPYTWTESTWMSLGLANCISKLGMTPSLFPYQSYDSVVCTDWDTRVVPRNKADFSRWHKKCSVIIWVGGINKDRVREAAKSGTVNILLVTIHDLDRYTNETIDLFDYVLTPSVFMADALSPVFPDTPIMPVPWDPFIPIINKRTVVGAPIWLYVPMQSGAAANFGERVLYSLSLLLDKHSNTNITIVRNRRWGKTALRELYSLRDRNPLRVEIQVKPTVQERLSAYSTHDWTFYPYHIDDHGHIPLESIFCGTPVITFNSPFMREVIKSSHNGVLVNTDVLSYREGFTAAMNPSPSSLTDTLLSVVPNRKVLSSLVDSPWPGLESRRRAFQAVWSALLN